MRPGDLRVLGCVVGSGTLGIQVVVVRGSPTEA